MSRRLFVEDIGFTLCYEAGVISGSFQVDWRVDKFVYVGVYPFFFLVLELHDRYAYEPKYNISTGLVKR